MSGQGAAPLDTTALSGTAIGRLIAACCLLSFALGALYAFSVLIDPIEARYAATRAQSSATFSIAIGTFSVAMLLAPRAYPWAGLPALMVIGASTAALGLAIAALSPSIWGLWLGYGVIFGLANGFAYNIALQAASLTWRRKSSIATALVVGSYSIGALALAPATRSLTDRHGLDAALLAVAALFVLCVVMIPVLARPVSAALAGSRLERKIADDRAQMRLFILLLLAFGFGAGEEMIIIGHAAEIMASAGGGADAAMVAVEVSATAGAAGRLSAGWLADFGLPIRFIIGGMMIPATFGLVLIALAPSPALVLAVLVVTGLAYGLLAGGLPAAVAQLFGPERLGTVYGKLFYGYGTAGLAAPYLAGVMFDIGGDYRYALLTAAGFAALAACAGLAVKAR